MTHYTHSELNDTERVNDTHTHTHSEWMTNYTHSEWMAHEWHTHSEWMTYTLHTASEWHTHYTHSELNDTHTTHSEWMAHTHNNFFFFAFFSFPPSPPPSPRQNLFIYLALVFGQTRHRKECFLPDRFLERQDGRCVWLAVVNFNPFFMCFFSPPRELEIKINLLKRSRRSSCVCVCGLCASGGKLSCV